MLASEAQLAHTEREPLGLERWEANQPQDIAASLLENGVVIVEHVVDERTTTALRDEICDRLPAIEATPKEQPGSYKYQEQGIYTSDTKRIPGLVGVAQSSWGLMQHPLVLQVCDAILGPNCINYRLSGSSALIVGPGANEQKLHRDENGYEFYSDPRPHLQVIAMWALTDFTSDNGATWFVPGSHVWGLERDVSLDDQPAQAVMPAGSLALWLGRTFHGAGANAASEWRYGCIAGYTLGWLRSQQNQYVAVPRSAVAEMPESLRELVGYTSHGMIGVADYSSI